MQGQKFGHYVKQEKVADTAIQNFMGIVTDLATAMKKANLEVPSAALPQLLEAARSIWIRVYDTEAVEVKP